MGDIHDAMSAIERDRLLHPEKWTKRQRSPDIPIHAAVWCAVPIVLGFTPWFTYGREDLWASIMLLGFATFLYFSPPKVRTNWSRKP